MKTNINRGQSLFEVVVTIAISALIITAVVSLASNSIQNSSFSRDKTLASNYVQELNEWLREQRDLNSSALIAHIGTSSAWCFKDLSWSKYPSCGTSDYVTGTKFKRLAKFSVSTISGKQLIQIDTTVSWQDSKGTHEIKGSTKLSVLQ